LSNHPRYHTTLWTTPDITQTSADRYNCLTTQDITPHYGQPQT